MVIRSREIKYNKIIEVTPLHFTSCLDKKETILRHSFFINDEIESLSRFRLQTRGPKYQLPKGLPDEGQALKAWMFKVVSQKLSKVKDSKSKKSKLK